MKTRTFRIAGILLLLCLCAISIYASGGEAQASSPLDFLWKVVNFIVLVGALHYFTKKPISEAMNSSAEKSKQDLENAREAKRLIADELRQLQEKLVSMQKETDQMVVKAKEQAEIEKQHAIEHGVLIAEELKEHARFTIQQEYKKAEHDLKRWIAEEALALSEEKIKKQINSSHQKTLVERYMSELTS